MEISDQDYNVFYDSAIATIHCQGTLRLIGTEAYVPIMELFNQVVELELPVITLNIKKLKSLNSSGVTMLARFVIKVSKKTKSELIILGSKQTPWQSKSLTNLKRLMPSLQLKIE
mgnify:CR=1 FL=1